MPRRQPLSAIHHVFGWMVTGALESLDKIRQRRRIGTHS
jgi:hypothetical protein